ncbi:MAG: endonuclease NucS domain-containing protein [Candidatus Thorarchaeota archaeon]
MVKYLGTFEFTNSGSLKTFAWSSDGQYLAVVMCEGLSGEQRPRNDRITILNIKPPKRICSIEGDRDIRRISWLSQTEIVTQSTSNQILWKREGNQWIIQHSSNTNLRLPHLGLLTVLSDDRKWLAEVSASVKRSILIRDANTSILMGSIELPSYSTMQPNIKSVQWSPVGDRISVLLTVQKHVVENRTRRRKPRYGRGGWTDTYGVWSKPRGKTLFQDRIIILNPQKGTRMRIIKTGNFQPSDEHQFDNLSALCWNPIGTIIVGISLSYQMIFWSTKHGHKLKSFNLGDLSGISMHQNSIHWSPDGRHLAWISDKQVYVWDVSSISVSPDYIIPPVKDAGYDGSEKQLEDMIEKQPEVLGFGYKLLGRQVQAADGRIDLLMEGPDGAKVVVELKKDVADDVVVGQILRYLSWIDLKYQPNTPPRGIIVAEGFSDNLRLAVRASSFHIQLTPISMIKENYSGGK